MTSNLLQIFFLLFNLINFVFGYVEMVVPEHKRALDLRLYEDVLDSELCDDHINYLRFNNTVLLLKFLDAGIRTPRGLFGGNLLDLGNYHQCLAINQQLEDSTIEGKFCTIHVPLNQENLTLPALPELPDIPWPDLPWPELNPNTSRILRAIEKPLYRHNILKTMHISQIAEKVSRVAEGPFSGLSLTLAMCIPKTCTTKEVMNKLLFNTTDISLRFSDHYCRLPNDKPWLPVDYIAITIFSVLGILTVLSTGYDIHRTVFLARDPKQISKLLTSFSVYTNTRRLVTYTPVPGTLECLDGVRAFAMMWVIIGHTFVNQLNEMMANPIDTQNWITSYESIWITAAPITVDTFFMLSGLLVVYTTTGKLTRMKLLKNLHLFYLNRLLRMFPVLAAFILIQASILNRITDGPNWTIASEQIERCREFWWSTLLHIQNFLNPSSMCLAHSWYLAIDVQLHILSPLILFWVLGGRKRTAWIALSSGLLAFLIGSAIYNFHMKFPAGPVVLSRLSELQKYLIYYYVNTLTRASPFVVGMMYGYLLHLFRRQKLVMTKVQTIILWTCAVIISSTALYSTYPIMQLDWDNQTVDSIINTFKRPAWALSIGWLIFACVQGYGGPINWVLSLRAWKVLSRLSYAMYIVHYPLISLVNSTALAPIYFSVQKSLFKFLADFTLAAMVAFLLTILVDSPFSTLIKMFMGGPKRPQKATIDNEATIKNGIINDAYDRDEPKTSKSIILRL